MATSHPNEIEHGRHVYQASAIGRNRLTQAAAPESERELLNALVGEMGASP